MRVDLRAAVLLGDELGLVDDLVDLLLGELLLLAAFLLRGGVRREGHEPDGEQSRSPALRGCGIAR